MLLPGKQKHKGLVRRWLYLLCFKSFWGLKIFKPVWFLFPFVSDYGNDFYTKGNKIKLVWKIWNQKQFKPQHTQTRNINISLKESISFIFF